MAVCSLVVLHGFVSPPPSALGSCAPELFRYTLALMGMDEPVAEAAAVEASNRILLVLPTAYDLGEFGEIVGDEDGMFHVEFSLSQAQRMLGKTIGGV